MFWWFGSITPDDLQLSEGSLETQSKVPQLRYIASPFWQDPLGESDTTHPLTLFVGRANELQRLLNGLHGAGESSSRQAVCVGGSVSESISATAPRDMLLDGPRVLRDLLALVQASEARGLVLHINNLEKLSDADTERAGTILRDLRDLMLMHNGLHVIVVGTDDAVQAALSTHTQVRSTFHVMALNAFPIADAHSLPEQRYAHARERKTTIHRASRETCGDTIVRSPSR